MPAPKGAKSVAGNSARSKVSSARPPTIARKPTREASALVDQQASPAKKKRAQAPASSDAASVPGKVKIAKIGEVFECQVCGASSQGDKACAFVVPCIMAFLSAMPFPQRFRSHGLIQVTWSPAREHNNA